MREVGGSSPSSPIASNAKPRQRLPGGAFLLTTDDIAAQDPVSQRDKAMAVNPEARLVPYKMELFSLLACPECGREERLAMPTDACLDRSRVHGVPYAIATEAGQLLRLLLLRVGSMPADPSREYRVLSTEAAEGRPLRADEVTPPDPPPRGSVGRSLPAFGPPDRCCRGNGRYHGGALLCWDTPHRERPRRSWPELTSAGCHPLACHVGLARSGSLGLLAGAAIPSQPGTASSGSERSRGTRERRHYTGHGRSAMAIIWMVGRCSLNVPCSWNLAARRREGWSLEGRRRLDLPLQWPALCHCHDSHRGHAACLSS